MKVQLLKGDREEDARREEKESDEREDGMESMLWHLPVICSSSPGEK